MSDDEILNELIDKYEAAVRALSDKSVEVEAIINEGFENLRQMHLLEQPIPMSTWGKPAFEVKSDE